MGRDITVTLWRRRGDVPLYEIAGRRLVGHEATTFREIGLYERVDLQPLLRDHIDVIADDLLVIAEEFDQWEDTRRRIDLLALDRSGRLVVIELKRTDEGGHMELQALRYAAMVSSMGFDEVASAYANHLAKQRPNEDLNARTELLKWLEAGEEDGDAPVISSNVRIVLIAADFGPEITTTAMWLNGFEDMDVRCIRLVPYRIDERVLLDIQQVVPLPEAADYQVRLRRKDQQRERARSDGRDFTQYHVVVDGQVLPKQNKRNAVRVMVQELVCRGVQAEKIGEILGPARFRSLAGELNDADAVAEALVEDDRHANPRGWFLDCPISEAGRTWVLSKGWGTNTEPALTALAEADPEAKVTFRRAEA